MVGFEPTTPTQKNHGLSTTPFGKVLVGVLVRLPTCKRLTNSLPKLNLGVVVVVLTLTRIIKSVVTGQAPVTLELRNTPGKTHTHTTQGGTRIYHS